MGLALIELEKSISLSNLIINIKKTIGILFASLFALEAYSQMLSLPGALSTGATKIPHVSPSNIHQFTVEKNSKENEIKKLCNNTAIYFNKYKWKESPCGNVKWKADYKTLVGNPLIYAEFGKGKNTTLFLGGVHPDELTPIHLAFKFARYLQENPNIYENNDIKIVIAPLVNPDSFLLNRPMRTNFNGIDVNRNFFTKDWYKDAIKSWAERGKFQSRYFPGYIANSEIETLFQIKLIDDYTPSKIISVHSPLGFLDYDGPGDQKFHVSSQSEKLAKHLVNEISEKSKNYKVVDYSFYPGSLGNFAGNEREIPTITLELKTADPHQVDNYWNQFLPGLLSSAKHPFFSNGSHLKGNASNFSQIYTLDSPKG